MIILLDGGAKNGGEEVQVFFHGQILVKGKFPGHVAADVPDLLVILYYVKAFYSAGAGIG